MFVFRKSLTLEKVAERAEAMRVTQKQSTIIIYATERSSDFYGRLKITHGKYDFLSNKCYFHCRSSTHFANKCSVTKLEACRKSGKEGHFAAACKSKFPSLTVNLLQIESSSDEEYYFTINSPLAKTTFTFKSFLAVVVLLI